MNRFGNRIRSLSRRERLVLVFGGIGAALIITYSFVWQPWQEELDRLRTLVPTKRETLAWMQQQTKVIGPLVTQASERDKSSDRPLLTIIEGSAKTAGMGAFIRRMTPGEGDQVKIWLTEADFNNLMVWLEALRGQGIEVESADINRAKGNEVTIRLTLQR